MSPHGPTGPDEAAAAAAATEAAAPDDRADRAGAADAPARAQARARAHARWLQAVQREPWGFDLYHALRRVEAAHPHLPRLGEAVRPGDEPLRVGQPAEMTFPPAPLHSLELRSDGPPRLNQRVFGLLGPNGALPTHLTELARERARSHGDATLQRFLDLLTHRFALLFYRAWAQAQPHLGLDRPGDRGFARRLGALAGIGTEALERRDEVGDAAKLHFIGRLARHVRDAEGLLAWCRAQFDVPVRLEQWCGHWMALARDERTRLQGRAGHGLGHGAVLGSAVWDVQHKFRLVVGPLDLTGYRTFLPGGANLARLRAIVRQWIGLELDWDVCLVLRGDQVPPPRLGGGGAALGRSTWLGARDAAGRADAADLVIPVERALDAQRRRAQRRAAPAPDPASVHSPPPATLSARA